MESSVSACSCGKFGMLEEAKTILKNYTLNKKNINLIYINTGSLPTNKSKQYINKIQEALEQNKYFKKYKIYCISSFDKYFESISVSNKNNDVIYIPLTRITKDAAEKYLKQISDDLIKKFKLHVIILPYKL